MLALLLLLFFFFFFFFFFFSYSFIVVIALPFSQAVALVGLSGSGKSTISSLLLRLYEPSSGEITINGRLVDSITHSELHHLLAIVQQEPPLFNISLRDNIAYAIDVPDDKVSD